MFRPFVLVILSLIYILLSACSTPYQANGLFGGYSEVQLNQDTYQITFKGNAHTSRNQVNNYLLRRAAELTQQNGYRYFALLEANEQEKLKYFTTPTTVNETNNGFYNGKESVYGQAYEWAGSSTNYSDITIKPGQTYKHARYENSIVIKMLNRKPGADQVFLDAATILKINK